MADATAAGIGDRIVSILKLVVTGGAGIVIALIIIGIVVGIVFWVRYRKKFDIDVEITSERSGAEPVKYKDRAAILIDRETKTKYFKLWYDKTPLPVPPYNVLERIGAKDRLSIWKKSDEEYYFLTPPKVNKNLILKQNGKIYRLAEQRTIPVETNIGYWNIKRKNQHKKLFDTESLLMKILPYIPLIVGSIFMLMMLYVIMNYLPPILAAMKDVAQQLSSLKGASVTQYN